jgi:hypothetical protein
MVDGLDGVEVVRALPEPNAATNGRTTEGHAADTTTPACCCPESTPTNVTIDHQTHTSTTAATTTPPTADRDGDGESMSMPGGSDEARAAAALERMLPATEAERQAEGLDFTFNDTTCRPKHRHIPIVYDGVFSSDRACQTDLSESGDIKKVRGPSPSVRHTDPRTCTHTHTHTPEHIHTRYHTLVPYPHPGHIHRTFPPTHPVHHSNTTTTTHECPPPVLKPHHHRRHPRHRPS